MVSPRVFLVMPLFFSLSLFPSRQVFCFTGEETFGYLCHRFELFGSKACLAFHRFIPVRMSRRREMGEYRGLRIANGGQA